MITPEQGTLDKKLERFECKPLFSEEWYSTDLHSEEFDYLPNLVFSYYLKNLYCTWFAVWTRDGKLKKKSLSEHTKHLSLPITKHILILLQYVMQCNIQIHIVRSTSTSTWASAFSLVFCSEIHQRIFVLKSSSA